WYGVLEESRFANSAVKDINANGSEDDTFGILVIAGPGVDDDQAVVRVDTDADRDWADEKPLQNYHLKYDTFQFAREKKEKQIAPLTCALNIDLGEKKVTIHFDDGGHGTHVAGIAAGYRINGQRDFHGIAPGAKIISLKIGDNTLAGGATTTASKKKAFEYAAKYARDHNVPVVCNLSYGIGSELEGQSDIDVFLDKLCKANPNVIVFSSAGNLGPGLSTVGTPAAGQAVISVAALLGVDSARDVMGLDMKSPQVAVFSSRGGELSKPTIAVPGYATSTVPRWNLRGDFWRGTSLASPYAAGLGAVMISSAEARYPDRQHRASWVKTALQKASSPMYGYHTLDYGAGIPDLTKAVDSYQQMVSNLTGDVLFDYEVSTESPLAPGGKGSAAFWRTSYYPDDRSQVFEIKPRFAPTFDAESIASFSRQYRLKSDADWLVPQQQQVYFRSEQSANVRVDYDAAKLSEPGLYVGTVEGVADGHVGFRLVNTVVVPHRFGPQNEYRLRLKDQKVDGWQVRRHFVAVPPGASAMHVSLRTPDGKFSNMRIRSIFKPNGDRVSGRDLRLNTRDQKTQGRRTVAEELQPGVWEITANGNRPDETSHYDLEVRFSGVHTDPPVISGWKHPEGELPNGEVTLTQLFDSPVPIETSGMIEGYEVSFDKEISPEDDTAKRSIKFNPQIKAVRIETEFSEVDFARFTDVAVNVFDGEGKAIAKDAMNYRRTTLTASNPDPAKDSVSCDLEVQAAFADSDPEIKAKPKIKLTYLYAEPINISVSGAETLYPGIAEKLKFKLASSPPENPKDTATVGYVKVTNRGTGDEVITVPIRN
ncbi:MAG: S8 family serine peptidase, partial [Phycisphaeraceae bacterium]